MLPYSRFTQLAKEQQVENLVVTEHYIRGTMKDDSGPREFVTDRVDPAIATELAKMGLSFTGGTESSLLRDIVSWVAPVLVFFCLWGLLFRKIAEKQGLAGGFIERAFAKATGILQDRRAALLTIAKQLLEKETLSGAELKALLESAGSLPPRAIDAGQRKCA